MTEQEWLECTDPERMISFMWGKASRRKLTLFACACCRRIWRLLSDPRSKETIEILEDFLDGSKSGTHLSVVNVSATYALKAIHEDSNEQRWYYVHEYAARAVCEACSLNSSERSLKAVARCSREAVVFADKGDSKTLQQRVCSAQAACLREIIGNPFRPVVLDPIWRSARVLGVGQAAYVERRLPIGILDPNRVAVLADALEDAGCDNTDILDHLRGPGQHVRGCWVVDLLLHKE